MNINKLIIGICALPIVQSCSAQKDASKPNILFIAVDDMNDWNGPLGGLAIAKTPNLDRLASQGVTFTNAHCTCPASAPSRLAIMTGVQPSKTDIMQNTWYDGPQWRKIPLLEKIETIEQFFKNRGYETLGGGKIYHTLAPPWMTINQAEPGDWDFYFPSIWIPIPYQIRAEDNVIRPEYFKGRRPNEYFTWGPINIRDEKMADYQVVDWARYVLSQKHEKPFYLACGIFRPHMPWEVPQKYFDMYPLEDIPDLVVQENDLEDAYDHGRRYWHKFVLENNQWKKVIQAYLASVSFSDAQIGRLLDGLESSEFAENTIVVLWSDHGMHIGEKENWEKFTLWEESTRIPVIFKVPGAKNAGSKCSEPITTLDVYPTLVELAGFQAPAHCDGKSIVSQIKDVKTPVKRSALTSYRFVGQTGNRVGHSLRNNRYRYIYYEDNSLEELYDHETDPNEFTNLAYDPKYSRIISDFRSELVERVGRVSLDDILKSPVGYTIRDGRIHKDNFIPLEEIELRE
jgi:arylsulfatase A-like enzyme